MIATLTECRPFYKYWQLIPDPGARCRLGYAQLITMGASDVTTDLLLVGFPIPIVMKSALATKRYVEIVLRFFQGAILIPEQQILVDSSLRAFPDPCWDHNLPCRWGD